MNPSTYKIKLRGDTFVLKPVFEITKDELAILEKIQEHYYEYEVDDLRTIKKFESMGLITAKFEQTRRLAEKWATQVTEIEMTPLGDNTLYSMQHTERESHF